MNSGFCASDPRGYVIDGTNITMYRVTCANGDWVDFNTYDLAKSNGASSCRGMGSSFVDIKTKSGSNSSKWGKELPGAIKGVSRQVRDPRNPTRDK